MKKIIAAAILISCFNAHAEDVTDQQVPCSKVRGGGEEFGCSQDERNIKNEA